MVMFNYSGQEFSLYFRLSQPFQVRGEGRMVPDLFIKGQSDKPTEQNVLAYLCHRQAVAPDSS